MGVDIRDYLNFGEKKYESPKLVDSWDVPDYITYLMKQGHNVCVYGYLYADKMKVANTDLRFEYLETVKPTSANGEYVIAVMGSDKVLAYNLLQSMNVSTINVRVENDGLLGDKSLKADTYTYLRYQYEYKEFIVPDALFEGRLQCCVSQLYVEFSKAVVTELDVTGNTRSVTAALERRIDSCVRNSERFCAWGLAYPDGVQINDSDRKLPYFECEAPQDSGRQVIAVIWNFGVSAWKYVSDCVDVQITGAVDDCGYCDVGKGIRFITNYEEPSAYAMHVVPKDMVAGKLSTAPKVKFQLCAMNYFEEPEEEEPPRRRDRSTRATLTAEDVVDSILRRLPPATVNNLSKQEKYRLAIDTVKKLM